MGYCGLIWNYRGQIFSPGWDTVATDKLLSVFTAVLRHLVQFPLKMVLKTAPVSRTCYKIESRIPIL